MPSVWTWRRLFLLFLLGAALTSAVLSLRPEHDSATIVQPPTNSAHYQLTDRAPDVVVGKRSPRPNPAVQKPGPPDPVAQKTAAASADSAASAAATLAASVTASTH